jgi:hypothetical protein
MLYQVDIVHTHLLEPEQLLSIKKTMAHFAKIDDNNVVLEILVVHNNELINEHGVELEELGVQFLSSIFNHTTWKQTSYNKTFRKNYAGIGYTYDASRDAFIPPKPYNSWILNADNCQWEPPILHPDDGKIYIWNEDILSWSLLGT